MRGVMGPALASVAAIVIVAPAVAQLSQKWAWCVNQGGAFSADQRINGCSSIIKSGGETRGNLSVAYHSRGLAYYDKGDDDRAIAEYNEAIRLDPKFAQAYSSRGLAYDHKGDLGRAETDYNEAIRLDPKYAQAYFNRGNAYYQKGDTAGQSGSTTEHPMTPASVRLQHIQQVHEASGRNLDALMPAAALAMAARAAEPLGGSPRASAAN